MTYYMTKSQTFNPNAPLLATEAADAEVADDPEPLVPPTPPLPFPPLCPCWLGCWCLDLTSSSWQESSVFFNSDVEEPDTLGPPLPPLTTVIQATLPRLDTTTYFGSTFVVSLVVVWDVVVTDSCFSWLPGVPDRSGGETEPAPGPLVRGFKSALLFPCVGLTTRLTVGAEGITTGLLDTPVLLLLAPLMEVRLIRFLVLLAMDPGLLFFLVALFVSATLRLAAEDPDDDDDDEAFDPSPLTPAPPTPCSPTLTFFFLCFLRPRSMFLVPSSLRSLSSSERMRRRLGFDCGGGGGGGGGTGDLLFLVFICESDGSCGPGDLRVAWYCTRCPGEGVRWLPWGCEGEHGECTVALSCEGDEDDGDEPPRDSIGTRVVQRVRPT